MTGGWPMRLKTPAEQPRQDHDEDDGDEDFGRAVGKRRRLSLLPSRPDRMTISGSHITEQCLYGSPERGPNQARASQLGVCLLADCQFPDS